MMVYAVFRNGEFQEIARSADVAAMIAGVRKHFDISGSYEKFNHAEMWAYMVEKLGYELKQCKLEELK